MKSKEKKQTRIRDIVHDYIYITDVEKYIIETPIFQRLRFVLQNSSAYLTYPSNQLTRFSHSLGVMHLGGEIFLNALRNTDKKLLRTYLDEIYLYLEENVDDFENFKDKWQTTIGNISGFTHSDIDVVHDLKNSFTVNFLWQSVRLACLVHDIGHLPFSHIFEMGIESYEKKCSNNNLTTDLKEICKKSILKNSNIDIDIDKIETNEIHEIWGAYLIQTILNEFKDESDNFYISSFRRCFNICLKIFCYKKQSNRSEEERKLLKFLHQIVSSDLDADRIDYVLRDAISSGINMGNFDLQRLLDNFILFKNDDKYELAVNSNAISSIEQFFNYRYLLYEYIYYHHNVAKYDGLLIEIISNLLYESINNDNEILSNFLVEKKLLFRGKDRMKIFYLYKDANNNDKDLLFQYFDDCWLRNLLQELILLDNLNNNNLKNMIETFLFRQNKNMLSLYKNDNGIKKYLQDCFEKIMRDEAAHKVMTSRLAESNSSEKIENYIKQELEKLLYKIINDVNFIIALKKELETEFILIIKSTKLKLAKEYKDTDDRFYILYQDNTKKQIIKSSPYLSNLSKMEDMPYLKNYLGVYFKDSSHPVEKMQEKVNNIFVNLALKYINNDIFDIQ